MGKKRVHPERHRSYIAECNGKQSISKIVFILGLFLFGCSNRGFSNNNPNSIDGSADIDIDPSVSTESSEDFSRDEMVNLWPNLEGEYDIESELNELDILDSGNEPLFDEEIWDWHGREMEKWRGRAQYYATRRSRSLEDYYYYRNPLQGSPVPDHIVTPDLCYYTAKRNVNCRVSDYIESSLIAILMQGEEAKLLYLNPTFTHGKFELLNNSQCWIPLGLMHGPSDPYKMCQVYVVDAPQSRESSNLDESDSPVCSSGLDEASCLAAGGNWVDGGAVGASYCNCG